MKMKAGMVLKEVTVGELTLATGMPKIGVVLAGATREDLLRKAGQILTSVAVSYTHLTLPTICSV